MCSSSRRSHRRLRSWRALADHKCNSLTEASKKCLDLQIQNLQRRQADLDSADQSQDDLTADETPATPTSSTSGEDGDWATIEEVSIDRIRVFFLAVSLLRWADAGESVRLTHYAGIKSLL